MRIICLLILILFPLQAQCQEPTEEEFLAWIKTQSPENLAKFSADITAKMLPLQVDSLTMFSGIFAVEKTITYRVNALATKDELIKMLKNKGKTLDSYLKEFKTMVTNMSCTQKTNMAYIAQGVNYRYLVSDINFKHLFDVSVTNCP